MLYRIIGIVIALTLITLAVAPALTVAPTLAEGLLPSEEENPVEPGGGGVIMPTEPMLVTTQGATSITGTSANLNGYLQSMGPYSVVDVWFETADGVETSHQAMSSPGFYTALLGQLESGTAYRYRAMASSTLLGGQHSQGAFVSFTTQHTVPQAPIEVSTSSASDITSGSAVLRGYLSSMGPYTSVTVWFQWGSSTGYGNNTVQETVYGPGPFSMQVSGLSPNSMYYFRAAAKPDVVGVSTAYGAAQSFSTPGAASLAVSTGSVSGVTNNSATLVGYLESLGGYRNAYVWFEWGPTTAYGQTTTMQTMYSPGTFNYTLQGLNPGATYHFRALAVPTQAGGMTVHGFDSIFTTTAAPGIKVSTSAATNITGQSASFNGYLTAMGASSNAYVWFEYGTDTTYGNSTPQQNMGMPGSFSYSVNRLQRGLTYYYRAAAFSNGYNVYGQYSTFQTTPSSPVSVTTGAASGISTTAATLNAYVNSLGGQRSVQVYFNFGKSMDFGSVAASQTVTLPGTVSYQIMGLTPGTTYYFQAVAQTPDNLKVYGATEIFSTVSNSTLGVATYPATAVTASSAILNGYLQDIGNTSTAQVWFEYGTTADFGNTTDMQTLGRSTTFSTVVTGLAPGRTYYYRAVALNPTAGGRSVNGAVSSFVTTGSGPTPPPVPGVPIFVWLIISGFVIVIIIVIILLASRR
jgi:phosphodiesterase/alkaline phosphatase D-like protein